MKYYFDARYGKTITDPLQIIFVKDGNAYGINKNNHRYYDASNTLLQHEFCEIDLIEVNKKQADDVLFMWGVK